MAPLNARRARAGHRAAPQARTHSNADARTALGQRLTRSLTVAAIASYVGSCALGTLATLRRGSTRRIRGLHHALYVSTFALTGAAVGSALLRREREGMPLLWALGPLTLIPRVSGRSRTHRRIALVAAPGYLWALWRLRRNQRSRGGNHGSV